MVPAGEAPRAPARPPHGGGCRPSGLQGPVVKSQGWRQPSGGASLPDCRAGACTPPSDPGLLGNTSQTAGYMPPPLYTSDRSDPGLFPSVPRPSGGGRSDGPRPAFGRTSDGWHQLCKEGAAAGQPEGGRSPTDGCPAAAARRLRPPTCAALVGGPIIRRRA
jgi:hypothetical protein